MIKISQTIVLSLGIIVISGCIDRPINQQRSASYPGMVLIHSKDAIFQIGSLDQWASDDEKPLMRTSFSYDFWIDTIEITISNFWKTTGYLPKSYSLSDTSRNAPICNITWYDAILYCNQRSKNGGLDTVYSYTGIEKTNDGRVYRITGIVSELNKNGYRLPTEAEWEFAASAGAGTIFPWGDSQDSGKAGNRKNAYLVT